MLASSQQLTLVVVHVVVCSQDVFVKMRIALSTRALFSLEFIVISAFTLLLRDFREI